MVEETKQIRREDTCYCHLFFRTAIRYSLSAFSQCEKIAGFPFFYNWMAYTQFLYSNITRENYNFAIEGFASKIEYMARDSVISVPHQLTIFWTCHFNGNLNFLRSMRRSVIRDVQLAQLTFHFLSYAQKIYSHLLTFLPK